MANYTSTIFATPQEFEEWLNKSKQLTDEEQRFEALKVLCPELVAEWNNKACDMCCTDDGKMQLLCKDGNVLAEIDVCHADGNTLVRDSNTGKMTVTGIKDCNSLENFSLWFGTEEDFKKITVKDAKTIYIYTTDFEDWVKSELTKIINGTTVVAKATHAVSADNAANSTNADTANNYNTTTGNIKNKFAAVDTEISNIKGGATKVKKAEQADNATTADNYNTSSGTIKDKFVSTDNAISTIRTDVSNVKDAMKNVKIAQASGLKAGITATVLNPECSGIYFDLYRNILAETIEVTGQSTTQVATVSSSLLVNQTTPLFRFITNWGVCYVRAYAEDNLYARSYLSFGAAYTNVNGSPSLSEVSLGVKKEGSSYLFIVDQSYNSEFNYTTSVYAIDEIVGHPLFG